MNNNFEVLRNGSTDEFDILSMDEMSGILGGYTIKCAEGFSMDDNGKIKCGCGYEFDPDIPPVKPDPINPDPVNPGPQNP